MIVRRLTLAILFALFVAGPAAVYADDTNANILRMATGTHSFYEEDGTTLRGQEHFRMIAHADGSRTMMLSKNMFDSDRQHNITMRVDPQFRPIEAYGSYWYPEGLKGSVRVIVDGDSLQATSWGPVGRTEHEVSVPPALAVVTHGEGLNAWSASVLDPEDDQPGVSEREMARTSYFISPTREGDGPVLGKVVPATLTRVGEETVTVPAGTFDTIHYRTGMLDIWAIKGDRVLAKQIFRGEHYLLTEYEVK